jgi:hypothetical protein
VGRARRPVPPHRPQRTAPSGGRWPVTST